MRQGSSVHDQLRPALSPKLYKFPDRGDWFRGENPRCAYAGREVGIGTGDPKQAVFAGKGFSEAVA